ATPPGIVVRAAFRLHRLVRRVTDALVPADLLAYELASGVVITALVGAAARHAIPDLLAERPMTSAEIAERIGAHPDATHRMMRGLVLARVFALGGDGKFRNTQV